MVLAEIGYVIAGYIGGAATIKITDYLLEWWNEYKEREKIIAGSTILEREAIQEGRGNLVIYNDKMEPVKGNLMAGLIIDEIDSLDENHGGLDSFGGYRLFEPNDNFDYLIFSLNNITDKNIQNIQTTLTLGVAFEINNIHSSENVTIKQEGLSVFVDCKKLRPLEKAFCIVSFSLNESVPIPSEPAERSYYREGYNWFKKIGANVFYKGSKITPDRALTTSNPEDSIVSFMI